MDARFLIELQSICETKFSQFTEQRVDVSIAVDMVVKAHAQEYDAAYILTADGDFVPAVLAVKALGEKSIRGLSGQWPGTRKGC